jgi:predicted negative regulator of RcsB-dependent stress response
MDRNTVTGIILIFLIFLGFSLYNNHRTGKFFEAETEYADSLYAAGNYDEARESYIRALNFKPKDQPTINKVKELNTRLGLRTETPQIQAATVTSDTAATVSAMPVSVTDSNAYGVF